jgi:hypothetical protein
MMESPRLPIIWYFDQDRVRFAVLLSVLNGFVVSISATDNFGFIARKSEPTVWFGLI